ncbi:MAG: MBL fold metallo-hydrolase [Gammaproteobacteria bacterium]|nr:MBL fold metallo-hydrolase [Gammaproteobacteria bacterium]MDH3375285.1 MBL fold metallo-hydrolase [Gammaproteobacteria bacterium]MDH3408795.1 MBL fold metallo-hydrolase [Gammaproteobacteria bacterium]MDH3552120.1 MBL fold metallo-hydrolase [Gammaproteobacteria bacterium]
MRDQLLLFTWVAALLFGNAAAELAPSEITQVVLLGTGTPNAEPDRSGPAVAIVVNDTPYIVDFGPGIVRQATAMAPSNGGPIAGLEPDKLAYAFLTHLHSDHTLGLPDLLLTPWVLERDRPLELFGPEGTRSMAEHILEAYDADIKYRLYGLEPANNRGWRVNVHEISEGIVFEDDNVKVEAFPVRHGTRPNAFGFRFATPDRVIVISGDAAPDPTLETYAKDADILIHEVYSVEGFQRRDPYWQKYHSTNHTSSHELGKMASRAKPGLLVLYHILFWGASPETVLKEVREKYSGEVVLGNDLDVF